MSFSTASEQDPLLLWSLDGQVRQQIPHPAGVAALAWSPAGKLLASGSGTSVRFFDGRTAAPLSPARNVHTAQITNLAWSQASGHPLISGSCDQRALVWGTQAFQPQGVFSRHTTTLDALSCQPGSTTVASASQGGAVRIWCVDTLTEVHAFYQDAQLHMRAVAFVPEGNQLAVGGNDGLVRLWGNGVVCQRSAVTAQGILCIDVPLRFRAHTAPVRSISWSPDGHFLATGRKDLLRCSSCGRCLIPSSWTHCCSIREDRDDMEPTDVKNDQKPEPLLLPKNTVIPHWMKGVLSQALAFDRGRRYT